MTDKNKTFLILIIIFFVVFVGTGVFLAIVNNRQENKNANGAANTVNLSPTPRAVTGAMTLSSDETSFSKNSQVKLSVSADSAGKNIVGYDLLISYDPLALNFVGVASNLANFKIYSYQRKNYIALTSLKTVSDNTPTVFSNTKLLTRGGDSGQG